MAWSDASRAAALEARRMHAMRLTHVSDAIGYYIHSEFPVVKPVGEMADMY